MDDRVAGVLHRLDDRARTEATELDALNALGPEHVRAAAARLMLDVGPEVGALLNVLVRCSGARRIVEVGGSIGYSTIWLAEAASATGGTVVSIEPDEAKLAEQRENLAAAGLAGHVRQVAAAAEDVLPTLDAPFDLVLIDHWKALYVDAFEGAWPRLRRGGLVVADNVLRPEATIDEMRRYIAHVRAVPDAVSVTLDVGDGVELTCRAGRGEGGP